MKIRNVWLAGFFLALLGSAPVLAQQIPTQANPAPGCASTPAQTEATKKAALDFAFLTGEAKVALADPTYIQHNPASHKRAQAANTSDFEDFKKTFLAQAPPRWRRGRPWSRRGAPASARKSGGDRVGPMRHRDRYSQDLSPRSDCGARHIL